MHLSRTLPKITFFFLLILFGGLFLSHSQEKLVDSLLVSGEYQEALLTLKNSEDEADAQFKMAEIHTQMGNPYKAARHYEKSIELGFSNLLAAQIRLIRTYLSSSQPAKALDVADGMKGVQENALVQYLIGKASEDVGKDEAAIIAFAKAIKLNPEYRSATISLIQLYLKKRRFQEAEDLATEFLESHPEDLRVKSLLAQVYIAANICYEAIPLLQELVDAGKTSEYNLLHLGECYLETNKGEKSLEPLLTLIELHQPTSGKPEFLLSKAYTKLDSLDTASRYIHRSIDLQDPDLAPSYTQLSIIHAQQKNYQLSLTAMQKAIDERPSSMMLRYQELLIYERLETEKEKLIPRYEQFLKVCKPDSPFHNMASQRLKDLKKMEFMSSDDDG